VDDVIGQLLARLDALGLAESTYVCFTSDHGEEFWEHGRYGHGQSVYDELTRVPLIIRGPGIQRQTVAPTVSAIDLMPTFADLLGVEQPPSWRGRSLGGVLRGEEEPVSRRAFLNSSSKFGWPDSWEGVRDRELKLVRTRGGRVELYNVAEDPGETADLAGAMPDEVERLETLMAEWLASFPDTLGEDALKAPTSEQQEDLKQRLETLGYL
jgi:arylsulfatase A-like enzyme